MKHLWGIILVIFTIAYSDSFDWSGSDVEIIRDSITVSGNIVQIELGCIWQGNYSRFVGRTIGDNGYTEFEDCMTQGLPIAVTFGDTLALTFRYDLLGGEETKYETSFFMWSDSLKTLSAPPQGWFKSSMADIFQNLASAVHRDALSLWQAGKEKRAVEIVRVLTHLPFAGSNSASEYRFPVIEEFSIDYNGLPTTEKNTRIMNDFGFFLSHAEERDAQIAEMLLTQVSLISPSRAVVFLNLGDLYTDHPKLQNNGKNNPNVFYAKYVGLMRDKHKEHLVPKRVLSALSKGDDDSSSESSKVIHSVESVSKNVKYRHSLSELGLELKNQWKLWKEEYVRGYKDQMKEHYDIYKIATTSDSRFSNKLFAVIKEKLDSPVDATVHYLLILDDTLRLCRTVNSAAEVDAEIRENYDLLMAISNGVLPYFVDYKNLSTVEELYNLVDFNGYVTDTY